MLEKQRVYHVNQPESQANFNMATVSVVCFGSEGGEVQIPPLTVLNCHYHHTHFAPVVAEMSA